MLYDFTILFTFRPLATNFRTNNHKILRLSTFLSNFHKFCNKSRKFWRRSHFSVISYLEKYCLSLKLLFFPTDRHLQFSNSRLRVSMSTDLLREICLLISRLASLLTKYFEYFITRLLWQEFWFFTSRGIYKPTNMFWWGEHFSISYVKFSGSSVDISRFMFPEFFHYILNF